MGRKMVDALKKHPERFEIFTGNSASRQRQVSLLENHCPDSARQNGPEYPEH
jgi:hypothetical protein